MKRATLLVCGWMSICAWAATQPESTVVAQVPIDPSLTAQQIVDRNVAARGGLKAWQSVTTLTLSGQLEAGGVKNPELPFVLKMKRSHKSRLELGFQNQTAVQVFDGANGWKVRPFLNRNEVEPYTASELKSAAAADELDGPLVDCVAKGTQVTLAGGEKVEGRTTYKLKLTQANGVVRHLWVDAQTFLEARIDGEPRKIDGALHGVSIYYRDYQSVNGITAPRVLETVVDGTKVRQSHKMKIERVAINEPMDDTLFAKPGLQTAQVGGR